MAEKSSIEWTDATWNPITGCSVVSPGCTNCYAMKLAGTRLKDHPTRAGLTKATKAGPVWTGEVRLNEEWLQQPLRWTKGRRVFVCAHGDLFHESVPDAWIDRVFAVMAMALNHTFQVLTKRAARMRAYLSDETLQSRIALVIAESAPVGRLLTNCPVFTPGGSPSWAMEKWPLPNVWVGVSAEDQTRADERIIELLATPAAVRFVSLEPLLGPIELCNVGKRWDLGKETAIDALSGHRMVGMPDLQPTAHVVPHFDRGLDWVIVGGESQHGSRPMHPAWARALRAQCIAAGVPFFFKQWGDWAPSGGPTIIEASNGVAWPDGTIGRGSAAENGGEGTFMFPARAKLNGRTLDGRTWDEMPRARP